MPAGKRKTQRPSMIVTTKMVYKHVETQNNIPQQPNRTIP